MDNTLDHRIAQDDESDFWNEIPDHVKQAIEQAKKEVDSGQGIPHAQVMADVKARFLNR